MKKLLLICLIFLLGNFIAKAQVTRTDATPATLDASIATRNFVFTSGDFGGPTSLLEVEVDLTLTLTNITSCAAGAYGVHNDIAVSLTSPSGTTVHLVQDFAGILLGFPPPIITYNDAGYPTIVNQTATYDDDATLLADDQTFFGAGTWKPQNPLSAFDGENPAGTWVLRVADGRNQFGADYTCYLNSTVRITGASTCTNPSIPTINSTPGTICDGNSALLSISGNLNDATQWAIYTGSCGGTLLGTTTASTFVVTPSFPSTTYYVRGEGGCVSPGSCGTKTVTVTALDNAGFNYSAAAYCVYDADPTPTITGVAGGTFSSTAGLSINASTGVIDVSASTPSTYTVTYTTAGTCPNSSGVSVTINTLDDASFSYSSAAYCADASDPTPTITGVAGGTFSSTAGLSINASTGVIDVSVSASSPSTYTVTYTTAGTCPNSSNVSVTINGLDDASFSYSASSYCANALDPTPTITGVTGGTFSSTAGLLINASTGIIDVSASSPSTYTVTYTTAGTCPNSSGVSVTINTLDDAGFNYSAAAYCVYDADPTPTVTGVAGGTFSSTTGLSINASTGIIDVSASTPSTYTVTYTTAGTCPNSSGVSITIIQVDVSTTLSNATITSNAVGATYQWLDCSNSMSIIPGETNNSYTATTNGSYAVQVIQNGCSDTSVCVTITTLGITPNSFSNEIMIYPNPTNDSFEISFNNNQKKLKINIYSSLGQLIQTRIFENSDRIQMKLNQPSGIYFVECINDNGNKYISKLIKK